MGISAIFCRATGQRYSTPMFFWIAVSFVILVILFVLITAITHTFLRVPYIPTPMSVVKEALSLANLRGNERVYDLGAGDARFLVYAKKQFPNLSVSGYELASTIWILGKMRILLSRQSIEWHMENMFSASLADADCVFVYLLPSAIETLYEKFTKELKPGTKVISYAFSLPQKTAVETHEVQWLTSKRKLYLYEW